MGQENDRTTSVRVVECPNCGARGCDEYSPDTFQCHFCKSRFRWSQPQRSRSSRRSGCFCGQRAVGKCTRCQQGMCKKHRFSWGDLLWMWQRLKHAYAYGNESLSAVAPILGSFSNIDLKGESGWFSQNSYLQSDVQNSREFRGSFRMAVCQWDRQFIQKIYEAWGVTSEECDHLLCAECLESSFVNSLSRVESLILEQVHAGTFCDHCLKVWAEQCKGSRSSYAFLPPPASQKCITCGQTVCDDVEKNAPNVISIGAKYTTWSDALNANTPRMTSGH